MDMGRLIVAIIETAIACVPIGLSLWALLDCAKRPGWAWSLANRSQQVWMATILCGILLVPVGLAVSTWYLVKVRPIVAGVEDGRIPSSAFDRRTPGSVNDPRDLGG
jgi:hypothetical protein